ncbi:MAG: ubiquinol-cytochrome c reductase iron-sulfur subunit [Pseudomonadota bacterium]
MTPERQPCVTEHERERRLLLWSTATTGGVLLLAAAWPLVASLAPSARALAAGAPVDVDLSRLATGELMTTEWRGRPVWILRRTAAMLATLSDDAGRLSDPDSRRSQQPAACRNATRALRPEYFVAVGICTHLGCVPAFRPQPGAADLGDDWPGGFYCPCHGSRFDLAGRVFRNVPAPLNLEIPPYSFPDPARVRIGA